MGAVLTTGAVGVAVLLGLWLTGCAWQRAMIFHPRPLAPGRDAELNARHDIRPLTVSAADGTVLRGWLVGAADTPAVRPAVIYFGGNAEEISWHADDTAVFAGQALALVCYRGYGNSAGEPGAKELLADALAVYDAVAQQPGIDARRIALMGRSIGTGLAVHVAAQRPVTGVVLVSPYDRFSRVAKAHFPYLPVDLLLCHNIDAEEDARQATAPLLAVIGLADEVIAPERSRALVAAWQGNKRIVELEQCGHNDMERFPRYAAMLREYFAGLSAPPVTNGDR